MSRPTEDPPVSPQAAPTPEGPAEQRPEGGIGGRFRWRFPGQVQTLIVVMALTEAVLSRHLQVHQQDTPLADLLIPTLRGFGLGHGLSSAVMALLISLDSGQARTFARSSVPLTGLALLAELFVLLR